jgi:hypothetical protein
MDIVLCCSEIEKLQVTPTWEKGLGLLCAINKRGVRFFLEYRQDWKLPAADGGTQISFCPYCGTRLQLAP